MHKGAILRWATSIATFVLLSFSSTVGAGPMELLDTRQKAQPWMGVGQLILGGNASCSGALIAPDVVLTAAHCLYDRQTGRRIEPTEITWLAGERRGKAAAVRKAVAAVHPPDYDYHSARKIDRIADDIALLRLDRPIRSGGVSPFGTGGRLVPGHKVDLVSYAATSPTRRDTPALEDGCRAISREGFVAVLTCDVDSGSSGAPVFRMIDGEPRIVAVVSAKAMLKNRKVALAALLYDRLDALLARLDAEPSALPLPVIADRRASPGIATRPQLANSPPPVRRLAGGREVKRGVGARFVRPD